MQIRYNRWVAFVMLGLGGLNLVLGLMLMTYGEFSFSIILGILFGFIGVMYFQRPYFTVEKYAVMIPALIGPYKREFAFRIPDDIKVEDNKLFVRDGERWKRVPVYKWFSSSDDWKDMKKYIQSLGEVSNL